MGERAQMRSACDTSKRCVTAQTLAACKSGLRVSRLIVLVGMTALRCGWERSPLGLFKRQTSFALADCAEASLGLLSP